jgi:hypothetical protein
MRAKLTQPVRNTDEPTCTFNGMDVQRLWNEAKRSAGFGG